jgi:hypothetical protein
MVMGGSRAGGDRRMSDSVEREVGWTSEAVI